MSQKLLREKVIKQLDDDFGLQFENLLITVAVFQTVGYSSEEKIKLKRRLKGVASDWLQILRIRLGRLSNPLHLLGFSLFKTWKSSKGSITGDSSSWSVRYSEGGKFW